MAPAQPARPTQSKTHQPPPPVRAVRPARPAHLHVTFRPSIQLVTTVRLFVLQLCQRLHDDEDVAERVAIATHELLENAMKYSTDGVAELEIDLGEVRDAEADEVQLRISNKVDPAALALLQRKLDGIHGAGDDAVGHYTRLMIESAAQTSGSGLGLARLWAETQARLSCEIAGATVTVVAKLPVVPRGQS